MSDGWWELKARVSQRLKDNLTPELVEEAVKYKIWEGKERELNDCDREHIAKLVREGYNQGEIVHEEDEEEQEEGD